MTKRLKFFYSDSCDLLNALETLSAELVDFGVKLEIVEGDFDGWEEVRLSKLEGTQDL